jgi:hypothetical protein
VTAGPSTSRHPGRRPLYEIAGVWIKRPDEMGSGNALRNADSPLERLGSWHRVRTGSNP